MTDCFEKAFPTTADLATWLAIANTLLFYNKESKQVDAAESVTYFWGIDVLPGLMKTKNKGAKRRIIHNSFRALFNEGDTFIKGIAYLNYLTFEDAKEGSYDVEEFAQIELRSRNLEIMGRLAKAYQTIEDAINGNLPACLMPGQKH